MYKSKILKLAEDALRKYAGQTHIGAVADSDDAPKKNRHDDFFSKFENAEMKQEAPLPVKEEVLVVEKSEPEVKEATNGIDKLTVNLDTADSTTIVAAKKTTPKVAKVKVFIPMHTKRF